MTAFKEHPLRRDLTRELHARPFEPLQAPVLASHLAVLRGEENLEPDRAHLAQLCQRFDVAPPAKGATSFITDLGPFRVRWESHTEFSSFTFFRDARFDHPFADPVIDLVPRRWLEDLNGEVFAAIHVALESSDAPKRDVESLSRLFDGHALVGSYLAGGAAIGWSDFQIDESGFSRILVRDRSLSVRQAGRLVQRLTEVNTYRQMALLALPIARASGPRIKALGENLTDIAQAMARGDEVPDHDESLLLRRLAAVAGDLESMIAETSDRYGATQAYFRLVQARLQSIRQERIQGLQTFSEFLDRRLTPAMDTCAAMSRRQDDLADRVARVTSLLRTRVEVSLEAQNRDLLHSMNRRAALQLRLQRTVEGLSVAAISYYLVSLIGYVLKGAKEAGYLPFSPELGMAVSVPIVVAVLWLGLQRLHGDLAGEE